MNIPKYVLLGLDPLEDCQYPFQEEYTKNGNNDVLINVHIQFSVGWTPIKNLTTKKYEIVELTKKDNNKHYYRNLSVSVWHAYSCIEACAYNRLFSWILKDNEE